MRYRVEGAPLWVAHCHCTSCRRNTGAALATFVGVSRDRFRITQGEPASYNSSPGVTRRFCTRCGTPLTYEATRYSDEVHVLIGGFDTPAAFTPTLHVWTAEQLPWLHLADELPRFAATSRDEATPR